jgi:large subunit ribosomal protein L10
MSKKVKNLITNELAAEFKGVEGIAVISPSGIDGIKNNLLRRKLREQGLQMTVVKNSLAGRAAVGTPVAGFEKLLNGPSAVIHGKASMPAVARFLVEEKKKDEKLQLIGLFFDGEVYEGQKGMEAASKLPTRQEAIANVLGMILGPGRKLGGAIKGPGGKVGGVLKAVEEKAKTAEAAAPAPAPAA